jgi:TFIIF-interacting CTD phosphatase-like protein
MSQSQLKKLSKVSNSNETVKCCRLQPLVIQQDASLSAVAIFFTTETKESLEMFLSEDPLSLAQGRIGQQR